MVIALLAALVIGMVLIADEFLWRRKILKGEPSRKMTHILAGVFIATWPYFLSWHFIQLLSVALLLGVMVSKHLHVFHFMEAAKRRTWGEYMFAVALGIIALMQPADWVFTVAILHLALADGLAALVGT